MAPGGNARNRAIGKVTSGNGFRPATSCKDTAGERRALWPAKKAATIAMAKGEI